MYIRKREEIYNQKRGLLRGQGEKLNSTYYQKKLLDFFTELFTIPLHGNCKIKISLQANPS